MSPKISIIVPVYKVEQYIHKCIDSILNQTFTDFELILVNDGSPDRCGEICEEYASKDKRIKVIHKENGGLSDARNAGLEIASGDYIGFVDSDDWIERDMYNLLYDLCIKNECEIAICTSKIHFKDKIKVTGTHPLIIHNREEAMKAMLECEYYDEVVWTKLFKKEMISDTRFPVGRIYEDTAFTYKAIDKCKKVCSIGAPKYNYIKREESVMDTAIKHIKIDAIDIYDDMLQFMNVRYPHLKKLVALKLTDNGLKIMSLILEKNNFKDYKKKYYKVANILNQYFPITLNLKQHPIKVKILLMAIKVHPIFYKMIMNLKKGYSA